MKANFTSSAGSLSPTAYTCGFCDAYVSAREGWPGVNPRWGMPQGGEHRFPSVVLCPNCGNPTYFADRQYPGVPFGDAVDHLPSDVGALYKEGRRCLADGNYSAGVMVGRKLLMHVAVERGAGKGLRFIEYVDYLANEGVVTPDMKDWVDEIRELGNDANHEIILMPQEEAEALMTFVSMLLKVVYEFPERGRRSVAARQAREQAEERTEPPKEGEPPPVLGA
jgi:Domain of unknown function (DUF4145)